MGVCFCKKKTSSIPFANILTTKHHICIIQTNVVMKIANKLPPFSICRDRHSLKVNGIDFFCNCASEGPRPPVWHIQEAFCALSYYRNRQFHNKEDQAFGNAPCLAVFSTPPASGGPRDTGQGVGVDCLFFVRRLAMPDSDKPNIVPRLLFCRFFTGPDGTTGPLSPPGCYISANA